MILVKRVASALAILALLIVAAVYLPSPISTAASIILAGFALLLLLPLILALVGMVSVLISDDDDGGLFDGIMDAWFMWNVLDWLGFAFRWPWIALKWVFARLWPDARKKVSRVDDPPFDREA